MQCNMCYDLIQDPHTVMTCLHKFCGPCINESMRRNQKHCPQCRCKIGSRRILKQHDHLKKMLGMLITDVSQYNEFLAEQRN